MGEGEELKVHTVPATEVLELGVLRLAKRGQTPRLTLCVRPTSNASASHPGVNLLSALVGQPRARSSQEAEGPTDVAGCPYHMRQ